MDGLDNGLASGSSTCALGVAGAVESDSAEVGRDLVLLRARAV